MTVFRTVIGLPESCVSALRTVRGNVKTPEDINDGAKTAPSKLIDEVFPKYIKTFHGPDLALTIGLDKIRAECPRFNQWVKWMESL